jgi:serine/threonine protein kinase
MDADQLFTASWGRRAEKKKSGDDPTHGAEVLVPCPCESTGGRSQGPDCSLTTVVVPGMVTAPMGGQLMAPPEIGERFAERYVVSHIAGGGGMSVVVGARHDHLGQLMAVKFLAVPSELRQEAVQRFFQEARAAASLRSEHIVRVTDAGTDEKGRHFIAMEYLDGSDLAHLLDESGRFAVEDAVGYILHACEGIAEAHAAGIVHRDLKPANLFVTRRIDGTPLVKVLDFGISKILNVTAATGDQLLSHPNSILGTPTYMSPEQLRTPGEVGARTDVWSMGLILLELLTGENPFAAATAPEIFAAILADRDPPPAQELRSDLPPGLSEVIARCLRKDPAHRTGSAGALAAELLPWSPPWAHEAGDRATRLCHVSQPPAPTTEGALEAPVVSHRSSRPRLRDVLRSVRGRLVVAFTGAVVVTAVLVFRPSSTLRLVRSAPFAARSAGPPSRDPVAPPRSRQAVAPPESSPGPPPERAPQTGDFDPVAPLAAAPRSNHASRPEPDRRRPRAKDRRGNRETPPAPGPRRVGVSEDPLEGRE